MNGTPAKELPKYKSHKEVWALKIKEIDTKDDGSAELSFEEEGYASILVSADFMKKHTPTVGGYYVVYKDDYTSFSPAKAFEEGYTLITPKK